MSNIPIISNESKGYGGCCGIFAGSPGTFLPGTQTNQGMIFLDAADTHYILARSRAELAEVLLSMIDIDDDVHLLRLAAACLECEVEAVMWVEGEFN